MISYDAPEPCHICGAIYPNPHETICSACWPDDPKRYWPGDETPGVDDFDRSDFALLPCPFCGAPGAMFKAQGKGPPYIPSCTRCRASLGLEWIEEEAARAWNDRTETDRLVSEAVARERERCAQVIDERAKHIGEVVGQPGWEGAEQARNALVNASAAIRAQGDGE